MDEKKREITKTETIYKVGSVRGNHVWFIDTVFVCEATARIMANLITSGKNLDEGVYANEEEIVVVEFKTETVETTTRNVVYTAH